MKRVFVLSAIAVILVGCIAVLGLSNNSHPEITKVVLIEPENSKVALPEVPKPTTLGRPEIYKSQDQSVTGFTDTIEEALLLELEQALGRKAGFEILIKNNVENWIFMCGRPLETDGADFDYMQSRLAKYYRLNMVDNKFCALLETTPSQYKIIEFDLGSPDNPYGAWRKAHDLPLGLIGGEK